jgi:hypothetical protein
MGLSKLQERVSVFTATVALVAVGAFWSAQIPTPLIALGNNAGGPKGMAESSSSLADSDQKIGMPNPFSYEYVAGANLSDQGGKGQVYQAELVGDPATVLGRVARAMGIDGTVSEAEYSTPDYPTYQIGSVDGISSSATITWTGTGNWWFSNPAAYPMPKCLEEAKTEDGQAYCSRYEELTATPGLLPSEVAMKAAAQKIFSSVGAPAQLGEITTYRDDYSAYATAPLQVAGQDTPFEWSVSWGSNGSIGSVSGHSVKFVPRGEFETVSAKAAVARIVDWRYSGGVASSLWSKYSSAIPVASPLVRTADDAVSAEPGVNQEPDVTQEQPDVTQEPPVEPKKVTVEINQAESALVSIWAADGSVWLVPGFILVGDQGSMSPVFSLVDGVVKMPVWSPELVAY